MPVLSARRLFAPRRLRRRVPALLRKAAEFVGVSLFAAVFVVFILQVVMRYLFNRPLSWTDELALIVYPWAVFWAVAFVVRLREHVAFDLLYTAVTPARRRAMALISLAILAGLFLAALPRVVDFVAFMGQEQSPVLGWRYDLVFAGFPLLLAIVGLRASMRIRRLLGRDWRREVEVPVPSNPETSHAEDGAP
jgi:TRAP-type C4-dicarboxylate transport system permease small subunit